MIKKKDIPWVIVTVVFFLVGGFLIQKEEREPKPTGEIPQTSTEHEIQTLASSKLEMLGLLDDLGYREDEVAVMKEILVNVGITEVLEPKVSDNGYDIQVIQGLAYTDGGLATPKEVHVQINIEKGQIYLVCIYCPSYGTSNQVPYLKGLIDRRADLYYDVEGGYIKRIDWGNRSVVDY